MIRGYLFWLIVANVLEVLLVLPEFILPPGTSIRPMAAVMWASLVAITALSGLICSTVQIVRAILSRRWSSLLVAGVGILLSLLPWPLYINLAHWTEQHHGLILEP